MPRKKKARPYARIAITLPPEVLAAADGLAQQLERSRSWVIAEAVRRFSEHTPEPRAHNLLREPVAGYQAVGAIGLGELRQQQLEADLRLTPGERVRIAEETARLAMSGRRAGGQQLLCFDRPEDYLEWKKRSQAGL